VNRRIPGTLFHSINESDIEPENKSDTNITESLGSAASRDLRVVVDCNPNNTDFVISKILASLFLFQYSL
jgi:hypothetical protein